MNLSGYDDLKFSIEAMTGGKNTVILDDVGMPSIMVAIPKFRANTVVTGGRAATHPAFIVNGIEKNAIYVSKYLNCLYNDRAYSLPFEAPARNINFDDSVTKCRNKGIGWGLTTNSIYAAIALWSKKNGTMPHGNTDGTYGRDDEYPFEQGILVPGQSEGLTLAGSGPATWNHDWTNAGISDLCGNLWEWTAGLRLVHGEIQIIPNSDALLADCDLSSTSEAWKAITTSGSLVAPGTEGTLKFTGEQSKTPIISTTTTAAHVFNEFGKVTADTGITIPAILKELTLFPADGADTYGGDWLYAHCANREFLPLRGGGAGDSSVAGVFYLYLYYSRSGAGAWAGLRASYFDSP